MNEINHPEKDLIKDQTSRLNETRVVSTDSASWFLFHPEDLKHRDKDPINWWTYDFAIGSEFAAGTIIGVTTGGDGSYGVRLTDEGLTEREKKYVVKSQSFRLKVRHSRLLIDGGYVLPCEYGEEVAEDSDDWISIPNGDYQVIVYALAWYEELGSVDQEGMATEKALPAYIAVFEAVQNLNTVEIPRSIPQLDPTRPEHTFFPNPESEPEEISWEDEYPVIIRPEAIFPGIAIELPLTEEQLGYVKLAVEENYQFQILITDEAKSEAVATLVSVTSYGSSLDFSDLDFSGKSDKFSLTGHGIAIVRLTDVQEKNSIVRARIRLIERPAMKVEQIAIDELKGRFARYAAGNLNYRKTIRHASFHAERVAALTVPQELGWAIASVLEMSDETKRELLSASESELIERLNHALKE